MTPIHYDPTKTKAMIQSILANAHKGLPVDDDVPHVPKRRHHDGVVARRHTSGRDFRPNAIGNHVRTIGVSVEQFLVRQQLRAHAEQEGHRKLQEERRTYGMFTLPPAGLLPNNT